MAGATTSRGFRRQTRVAAFAVWVVIWRVKFNMMENVAGLLGLCLIVFAVSVFACSQIGAT
jgi:hypothetical protein